MWGMTRKEWEAEQQPFEIWPDNWKIFELWQLVGDQWIMGSSGPVALNLIPILHVIGTMGLDKEDQDQALQDIKAMADEALSEIRKRQ